MNPMPKITTQEFQLIDIDRLVPYANNANRHSEAQIAKLRAGLREFGFINPLIIDREYGVLAGHGRLRAAKLEEMTQVPCVFADEMTEAQKKAYIIADNRLAQDAEWDKELLKIELSELDALGFDFALTGFDAVEIDELFADFAGTADDDGFDVGAVMAMPTVARAGDLWLLGEHRVLCGDSTNAQSYERLMDGAGADLILTDPPYNVDVEETAGKIMNDNMGDSEFYQFLLSAFTCMEQNLKESGSIYVWHADTEGLNFRKSFRSAGFHLDTCCIWKKNSLVLGRSPYQWIHEPCMVGHKQGQTPRWYADEPQSTVWEFDKPRSSKDHPTMKPVGLMSIPIQNSSAPGDIVLDPFLGSGSTLVACEDTGRRCFGIELDPKFMDVIVRRYIETQGGSIDGVTLIRMGTQMSYPEAVLASDAI